jgi:hypothetical protein
VTGLSLTGIVFGRYLQPLQLQASAGQSLCSLEAFALAPRCTCTFFGRTNTSLSQSTLFWVAFTLFNSLTRHPARVMPLVRPPPLPPRPSSDSAAPQTKQSPTLGLCRRSKFTQGHNDWLQIKSPRPIPNFDICPDCYNTSFRNTRYASLISAGPAKLANSSCVCDFSFLWVRLAYMWLFQQGQPDLSLLGEVASIQEDKDGICPNFNMEDPEVKNGGRPTVTRTWYCIQDPKTGSLVEEMTACSFCVTHVNVIFPCLKRMFVPAVNGQRLQGTCDLMTQANGQQRCMEYIDQIASVAQSTLETKTRDLTPLIDFVRKWGPVPTCQQGKLVLGQKQYSFPSTVPEFTACEECYLKHIAPLYSNSPQPAILSHLEEKEPQNGGFLCDLYSPRLQSYFTDACRTNDISTFRQKLTARNNKMQEVEIQLGRMKQQIQQLKVQERMHRNQMIVAQSQARMSSMQWAVSGWSAPPVSINPLACHHKRID